MIFATQHEPEIKTFMAFIGKRNEGMSNTSIYISADVAKAISNKHKR